MRVLLTGMTRIQANRPRRREYNTSINALYHLLKAAKHDVEWRPLEYGERKIFKNFDLLILGLGTISEFSCQYLYETLLASQGENVLYLVNDWKANTTLKLLRDADLFREFVLKNNTGSRLPKERVMQDAKRLETCRRQMFDRKTNIIGPFFGWGDRSIILNGTSMAHIHEFNPSWFYLDYWQQQKIKIPRVKQKQWVYGALDNYTKWHTRLDTSWPIHAFNKKTFIAEDELVKLYAKSHGMLMPKYKASGSGWWRARYCHAMVCENVIYAEEKEWGDVANHMYRTIDEIEGMSKKALIEFGWYQRKKLFDWTPSWDHEVDHINEILHEVAL